LNSILMEKPCLSLSDCGKMAPPVGGEEAHLEGINETTANYPQLMSLRAQVEKYEALIKDPNSNRELLNALLSSIQEATHSPNSLIAELAEQAIKNIKN
jgi:hypothetical protein